MEDISETKSDPPAAQAADTDDSTPPTKAPKVALRVDATSEPVPMQREEAPAAQVAAAAAAPAAMPQTVSELRRAQLAGLKTLGGITKMTGAVEECNIFLALLRKGAAVNCCINESTKPGDIRAIVELIPEPI